MTTVTKITGPVTVLMSWMNASASHFASVAGSGATSPKAMPAAIATSTQNQSWPTSRRPLGRPSPGAVVALAVTAALPSVSLPPPAPDAVGSLTGTP